MYQTITVSQFDDAFHAMGRGDQFSYAARHALYDYLEQYAEDTGSEVELDVIALCCDYTEYADFEQLQADYSDIESMEDLQNHTTVIEFDGGIIIQQF